MNNFRNTLDKLSEKFRPVSDKIKDFSTEPIIKDTFKLGSQAIDLAAKIGQSQLKNKWALAATIVGITDNFLNKGEASAFDKLTEFSKREKLQVIKAGNLSFLNLAHDSKEIPKKKLFTFSDGEEIFKIEVEKYSILYVANKYHGVENGYGVFASCPEALETVIEILFNSFGSSIQLEIDNHKPKFTPLKRDIANIYLNDHDSDKFIFQYQELVSKGINKSFLLLGPPGSGKSAFTLKIAEKLNTKLLLVGSSCLYSNYNSVVNQAINIFKPKVICFEDIERNSHVSSADVLTLIESVKANNPTALIFTTVNNYKKLSGALQRPGRLGRKIEFLAPDLKTRKKLIELYCSTYGCRDIMSLASKMDHPAFTHDYVKDICEHSLIFDDKELEEFLDKTISYLKEQTKNTY